jgi:hypothetical protein
LFLTGALRISPHFDLHTIYRQAALRLFPQTGLLPNTTLFAQTPKRRFPIDNVDQTSRLLGHEQNIFRPTE